MKAFFIQFILFLSAYMAYGQQRTITGTVTDASDGTTIPAVTVLVKGTTRGTTTDLNGFYSLKINETDKTIVFSFMGKKALEVAIGTSAVINARLESADVSLDELVVVGYGTMKKSDLTGSVASIRTDDLKKIPVNSFDQGIQGKVSGVQVTQLSAQPGGALSLRIRGGNSIMAGNEPLYVIDGVLIESQVDFSWIGSPSQNGLSSFNPNDIESIEILKDASATSIYGARGANGVVLITTKKGKAGKDHVSFETYFGMQRKAGDIEVMNASQFARLYDEAGFNADPEFYIPLYPNPDSLGTGTDWQSEIYRDAPIQNYQLSFSGSNEKTTYALTAGYYRQEGIIVGSDFNRYSFRLNLDRKMTERLTGGSNFSFTQTKSNTVPTDTPGGFFPGVVNTALIFNPVLPVKDDDGIYTLTDPNADAWLDNPVAVTRDVVAIDKVNRMLGNAFLEYHFLKELKFRSSFGIDYYHSLQDMYTPRYVFSGSFNDGQARFASSDFETYLTENTLNYSKSFQKKHSVNAMVGFTYQKSNSRTFIDIATKFPNDILGYYGIQNATNMPTIYSSFSESAVISYLGRVNYNYSDRYLFTLTGRIDGSSRFGANNRFATFPSAAFAWRASEEDFLKTSKLISNLKLRMSYGISGNDRIANYAFIRTISSSIYYFNNSVPASGFAPENPGNDNLKWETTRQADFGVDVSFLKDRISFTADYYQKYTYDLLYYANLPWVTGYTSYLKNIGELRNRGVELAVSTVNTIQSFKWNTSANISFNRNRIMHLNGADLFVNNDTYKLKIGNWAVIREGEEMGSFFGLTSDGIWQSDEAEEAAIYGNEPGDFKYVDQNNDGKINTEDCNIIGHALPDFTWGLTNNFSYGAFTLDIFIQGSQGNQLLNSNRFELESGNGLSNASVKLLDRWTPENPSDEFPRANRNAAYLKMSDRYLEDGSYIRVKTITLAYDLPKRALDYLHMDKLRLYITGQNLLTFTKYTGFDPEVSSFGMDNTRLGYDFGSYPSVRTLIFGASINF
ncbi:MAG: TonB-dependent receptor [Bacteroidales bacterium]|nr:TonB-dependent receptor [Bacteroidales bacterium]